MENGSDVARVKKLEDLINRDFSSKKISAELVNEINCKDYLNLINTLFSLTKDKNKRIVMEKTGLCPFGPAYDIEESRAKAAFLEQDLETAIQIYSKFVKVCVNYQSKRETNVAKQIIDIEKPILVLFGAGHIQLAEKVRKQRKVEVYKVHQNTCDYEDKAAIQVKSSGRIQTETYLRLHAQGLISYELNELHGKEFPRQTILAAGQFYVSLLNIEQIIVYRDCVMRQMRSHKPGVLLQSFLSKHNLPKTKNILNQLSDKN